MPRAWIAVALCSCMLPVTVEAQFKSKLRSTSVSPEPVRRSEPPEPPATLSPFQPVGGTPFLMAKVTVPVAHSKISPVAASSVTKIEGGLRNAVLFDLRDDTTKSLLPDNQTLIVKLETFPETPQARDSARWHVVEFVTEDTNDDGIVSSDDASALGIAEAGGERFAEVIPHLGEVFAKQMVDDETLLIIHGSQAQQVAARIHLPTRKIRSTKPLTNYGTKDRSAASRSSLK